MVLAFFIVFGLVTLLTGTGHAVVYETILTILHASFIWGLFTALSWATYGVRIAKARRKAAIINAELNIQRQTIDREAAYLRRQPDSPEARQRLSHLYEVDAQWAVKRDASAEAILGENKAIDASRRAYATLAKPMAIASVAIIASGSLFLYAVLWSVAVTGLWYMHSSLCDWKQFLHA